jgi:2-amino-4-hydroxy-6-hydroxymethyldihydropteridine diphosphokinase
VVWLGLGSNEGDRRANLASALERVRAFAAIESISMVYETEPTGYAEQPDFWNLVVRVRTRFEPRELLDAVKRIEADLGRRASVRWGPRPIDIDVLVYADRLIVEPDLVVPHPRMLERAFVLRPLADIDPDLLHPASGERFADMLSSGEFERIRRLFPGRELLGAAD